MPDSTSSDRIVTEIVRAYNNFDYQTSSSLLALALQNINSFPQNEKILIYQYGAFLAFQDGRTVQVGQYFWQILELDPTFTLDSVTTPPKLLTLFQKTKIEFLEEMNRHTLQMQQNKVPQPFPWRAMFPGWEQWYRGYHSKGILLGTSAVVTLTGTIVSIIQTQQRESTYLDATNPEEIAELYDKYQAAYQRQYYFGYAFIAIWALSQYDLAIFSHPRTILRTSILYDHTPKAKAFFGISFTINIL